MGISRQPKGRAELTFDFHVPPGRSLTTRGTKDDPRAGADETWRPTANGGSQQIQQRRWLKAQDELKVPAAKRQLAIDFSPYAGYATDEYLYGVYH